MLRSLWLWSNIIDRHGVIHHITYIERDENAPNLHEYTTSVLFLQVFVLCKTRKTEPSRRHLFLGQALLGGLFVCAAVSGLMCTQPTVLTCATVRLCTGLGYSMVFGTLLVKCVFLISLNGGVYLPAPYQALLLFFTVAIQLAIGVQWLIYTPPQLLSSQVSQYN